MSAAPNFTGYQTVARTIYGENRSGGELGMHSVANVIMNRAAHPGWWGYNPVEVCLMKIRGVLQFDCWDPRDPNYAIITAPDLDNPTFDLALEIADQALAGTLPDITNGAVNYYAASMKEPPYWARGRTDGKLIAGQIFFREA